MKRVLILASGQGTLANAIFSATRGYEIVALVCDRREAVVMKIAGDFQIPVELLEVTADRARWDQELFKLVNSYQPDLVVSAGFMRILAPAFVQKFKVINSHPSLLPLFPGAHAVRDALAFGASKTGTTIHWVDEGVDTGLVISQLEVEILAHDDEETLHERIKIVERGLIVATIPKILAELS